MINIIYYLGVMNMERREQDKLSHNPTVAAVVGAVIGALAAALLTVILKDYQYHDAVTYNNISSYIKSVLVDPGFVSEEILEKENPFQQIEMIGVTISEKESHSEDLYDAIRAFLIALGEKEHNVNGYTDSELIASLARAETKVQQLEGDNSDLSAELRELQSQVLAKLVTPKAYISGEPSDTTIRDYLAVINAHNYYSEEFLNSFLPKSLLYEENTIYYDKEAPEKTNVISANLTHDVSGFNIYDGSDHFTMGLQEYDNGISHERAEDHFMYIVCNGGYSRMTFTLGHVDNGWRGDGELTIYYMDNEGEYKEAKTISLFADMPVQDYSIDIYNTRTVKVVMTTGYYSGYGDYALADICLVK